MVKEAALKTKDGSGPSGLDADGWTKILVSKSYGTINAALRRAFANVIKKICTEKLPVDTTKDETPLEAFLACRLIPLDKNPGLRPIGVGEVLRRIAGKVVMKVVKEDIKKAAGCLQLWAGQEVGCEAAIHAMHKIFESNETEAILIVDAENAFKSINRKALLHDIKYLCPAITTFLYNGYAISARLFIISGKELRSREGTTQGDPTAIAAYALGLTPLLDYLQSVKRSVKHVAFADDLTGAGNLEDIKIWWDTLITEAPKYGYYPKPSKSFLIVKQHYKKYAERIFAGSNIKITTERARHLGAVLGDISFKEEYIRNEVHSWNKLEILSKIAEIQPQAAYSAYIFGFKHKFTFFLRTVPDIADYLLPIEEILRSRFIPAITGGHICSDAERALLALPVKFGGLGLQNLCEVANTELLNSKEITKELYDNVIKENKDFQIDTEKTKTIKNELKRRKISNYKNKLEELRNSMNEKMKRNDISNKTGSSNWLSVIPMREFNYVLNKQFWDSIRLRYGWPIPCLPVSCSCGEGFNVQHAMSCQKGGFVTLRHNKVRDITATLLSDVCKDVELEPSLLT